MHHFASSCPCLQLLALPSKRQGLFAPEEGTLIARSDTNGEDLEGYAGAGLYDRYVSWSHTALGLASDGRGLYGRPPSCTGCGSS